MQRSLISERVYLAVYPSCNPLKGIECVATVNSAIASSASLIACCNPLKGIECVATSGTTAAFIVSLCTRWLQSPEGD